MNNTFDKQPAADVLPLVEFQLTELEARLEMVSAAPKGICCECIFNTCSWE